MAMVEELKRKNSSAWRIRFYRNGRHQSLSLNSKYTRAEAEEIATMLDRWTLAEQKGEPLDRMTRTFFETSPAYLRQRFATIGIIEARAAYTLDEAWSEFFAEKSAEVSASSQIIWKQMGDRLSRLFNFRRLVSEITELEALESRKRLAEVYSEATVAMTIGRFRTFWSWCVKHDAAPTNVYENVRKGSTVNRSKDFQIPREWTERILDACPSQNWRTLFVLWRVAGLRQQEPLQLTWSCVNWEKKRLLVPSPKTSRYEGRESRLLPLFPILERELSASWEEVPEGEKYVVWENRRKNFDTGFKRILFWAGLQPWQKLFQNMRASAENDLVEDGYPAHVVGEWIGHTPKVQLKHYLRTLDSYFDKATQPQENVVEKVGHESEKVGHEFGHETASKRVKIGKK